MKDDLVTKAVMGEVLVEEVKEAELEGVMVTELPLLMPEVVSSEPAALPSLMCCTSEYTPGTVLQVKRTTKSRELCLELSFRAAINPLTKVRLGGLLFRYSLINLETGKAIRQTDRHGIRLSFQWKPSIHTSCQSKEAILI